MFGFLNLHGVCSGRNLREGVCCSVFVAALRAAENDSFVGNLDMSLLDELNDYRVGVV